MGLDFYTADFCPFAQRVHITLLEKEKDAANPVNFNLKHTVYFLGPEKDANTKTLFAINTKKEVPAVIYSPNGPGQDGEKILTESLLLMDFVDELFPEVNPLQPTDAAEKEKMRALMQQFDYLTRYFYGSLLRQDPEERRDVLNKLKEMLAQMDGHLKSCGGPFLCGEQFTLADIKFFPFVERIEAVVSHYRGLFISDELSHLRKWYKAVSERPSVQQTILDRTVESLAIYPAGARTRRDFLVEVYQPYSFNEVALAKQIFLEQGRPGENAYAKFKEAEAKGQVAPRAIHVS